MAATRNRARTDRQLDTVNAVRAIIAEGGEANAVQVAKRLGVTRMAAVRHLKACERKGLLRDVPKIVSSGKWALTAAGERS